jgi:hypothetical protein
MRLPDAPEPGAARRRGVRLSGLTETPAGGTTQELSATDPRHRRQGRAERGRSGKPMLDAVFAGVRGPVRTLLGGASTARDRRCRSRGDRAADSPAEAELEPAVPAPQTAAKKQTQPGSLGAVDLRRGRRRRPDKDQTAQSRRTAGTASAGEANMASNVLRLPDGRAAARQRRGAAVPQGQAATGGDAGSRC